MQYFEMGGGFKAINYKDFESIPLTWTPIGIVIVPASHNWYGDGSCGIVSLKYMSRRDPELGNSGKNTYSEDIRLYPPTALCTANVLANPGYNSLTGWGVLTETVDKQDWFNNIRRGPYLNKPDFVNSTGYGIDNFDTNFKGLLISLFTDRTQSDAGIQWIINNEGEDWKTIPALANDGTTLLKCCWRYHTIGTFPGDWYLWSAAEALYFASIPLTLSIVTGLLNSRSWENVSISDADDGDGFAANFTMQYLDSVPTSIPPSYKYENSPGQINGNFWVADGWTTNDTQRVGYLSPVLGTTGLIFNSLWPATVENITSSNLSSVVGTPAMLKLFIP